MKQITLLISLLSVTIGLVYALTNKSNKYNAYCEEQCLLISGEKNDGFQTPAFRSCVQECRVYFKSILDK